MVSFTLTVTSILTPLSPSPPIPLLHLSSCHDKLALTLCSHNSNSHSQTAKKTFLSLLVLPAEKNRGLTRSVKLKSQLTYPIISPDDHWGTWAALFATGAFGLWC